MKTYCRKRPRKRHSMSVKVETRFHGRANFKTNTRFSERGKAKETTKKEARGSPGRKEMRRARDTEMVFIRRNNMKFCPIPPLRNM